MRERVHARMGLDDFTPCSSTIYVQPKSINKATLHQSQNANRVTESATDYKFAKISHKLPVLKISTGFYAIQKNL